VGHDSFIFVTSLIHSCDTGLCDDDMTHSYVWDMTHSYVGHDSFICVTQGHVELERELPLHISDMTHS